MKHYILKAVLLLLITTLLCGMIVGCAPKEEEPAGAPQKTPVDQPTTETPENMPSKTPDETPSENTPEQPEQNKEPEEQEQTEPKKQEQEDETVEQQQTPKGLAIEMMSFNIRIISDKDQGVTNWESRKVALIEYLNKNTADIICMQEVKTRQYKEIKAGLDKRFGAVFYARENGDDPEGLMTIFDQTKYELKDKGVFWLSQIPYIMSKGWGANHYRICVTTLLEHKQTKKSVNVFNVHLDHKVEEARAGGSKLVLKHVQKSKHPALVAGDFNDYAGSECYNILSEEMTDCQFAPITDDGATYQAWGATPDDCDTPIDFIFATDKLVPQTYKICRDKWQKTNFYSDHYAIKTNLILVD